MKHLYLFFVCILHPLLWAQVTLVVKSIPTKTPVNDKIYLAGNINNWSPSDANYVLQYLENGTYSITIPESTTALEFKFTRGSWPSAEGSDTGGYIPNRTLAFTGKPQTIELTIKSWEDISGNSATSSAAENVSILSPSFQMPQLNKSRKIWLYLPPDYYTSNKKYPVLYLHDGQNLFDNTTSFSGEWGVDETLNNLHKSGDFGAIVIGIENGGADRINEYCPWVNTQYGGGQGEAYVSFIAETLKPYIDANYRTLSEAKNTVLGGSSLGGLISVYGACKYPNVFGKILSFSPAYWINLNDLNTYIQDQSINLSTHKIYTVGGKNESTSLVSDINLIQKSLDTKELLAINKLVKIDADGTHTEGYWKREFGAAYQWLFANENLSVSDFEFKDLRISYNTNTLLVSGLIQENQPFTVYNLSGAAIETIELKNGNNDLKNNYSSGIYIIKPNNNSEFSMKIYL